MTDAVARPARPTSALVAALLGFVMITLDAAIVNVVFHLSGAVTGLQWMLAALLPSAGSLADRVGARRALGLGIVGFMLASVACALNVLALRRSAVRHRDCFRW